MFNKRLEEYRNELGLNKKDMAEKLGISESYYNLIESGKRDPSKKVMLKLVVESDMPEEYWLYGIDKKDYIVTRQELKNTHEAIEILFKFKLFEDKNKVKETLFGNADLNEFPQSFQVIANALISDIQYLIDTEKSEK